MRRFVHCGTEAALIAGEPLVEVDETAPLRPDSKALYPATKALAEQAVRGASADGFETVVLRPALRLGRGRHHAAAGDPRHGRGRASSPGSAAAATSPTPPTSTTSSRGCCSPPRKGRAGEAYFVTDGDRVVFREFVSALLETQGVEPPTRSVPAAVAGAGGRRLGGVWRLLRLGGEPPLTRFAVWLSSQECTIDISKARSELGYEPVISRADGLAELRAAESARRRGALELGRSAASRAGRRSAPGTAPRRPRRCLGALGAERREALDQQLELVLDHRLEPLHQPGDVAGAEAASSRSSRPRGSATTASMIRTSVGE